MTVVAWHPSLAVARALGVAEVGHCGGLAGMDC